MQNLTSFAQKLIAVAEGQFDQYHLLNEGDKELCDQIKKYWTDLAMGFTNCVTVPWSAVFVSWCVKQAGATKNEFLFAESHSEFVHQAIQNEKNNIGVFRGEQIASYSPNIGDIIQNNRSGNKYDYNYAAGHASYESHSAIVTEKGQDKNGNYVITVGGNESNTVRQSLIRLDQNGMIVQRDANPYICIIKNMK